jgi:pimeloyl-ACP methyl ester carboxylesterase
MAGADGERTTAVSADGTAIAVLSFGRGPGLVVVPGNNRLAQHYAVLARDLSATLPVHVVERRARGASGPRGSEYGIGTEVEDVRAVLAHTGSSMLFGHSYGGLVALHVGLAQRLSLITAYEPGVMISSGAGAGFGASWLAEFTRLVDAGRDVAAMAVFLRGAGLVPVPAGTPKLLFRMLALLLLRGPNAAVNRALLPTVPAELAEVARLESDGRRYAAVDSPTVLLGGAKTPEYVTRCLTVLPTVMPNARAEFIEGLDHIAPDENAPAAVAEHLREHLVAHAAG